MKSEVLKNWKVHIIVLVLVCIAEWVGVKHFDIGIGSIALFPMLYVLVVGAILSLPKLKLMKLPR